MNFYDFCQCKARYRIELIAERDRFTGVILINYIWDTQKNHTPTARGNTSYIMDKMKYLIVLLVVLSLSCSQKKEYNVLFIISDDLTATAVSSYENKVCKTPNIDKLASEGVRYTKAYAQFPVCGPSRASIMSGYYPHATTTFGYVSGRKNIGDNHSTWPQLFKENGYYTARVSKIFHMGEPIDIELGSDGKDDPA